jgi:multiple sugar transport system permease protein
MRRREWFAAYALILPFLVVFVALLVFPLAFSGWLSLFRSQLIGGQQFSGLANYLQAVTDPRLLAGLGRIALFMIIQVPVMIGLALFFALALDSNRVRGQRFIRLAIFVPYAIPSVVAALMWGYIYGKGFGPIAQVFQALGRESPDLLSTTTMLGSLANIVTWEYVGYNMIILYAALRTIPSELIDAAEVDGAGAWRTAWSVKIPAIRPAILLTVIFSVIGSFQLFNEPTLLHSLAPNVIGTSYTPNLYAYSVAFVNQDVNYAAAIAFILGFLIMIVSYIVQVTANREGRGN